MKRIIIFTLLLCVATLMMSCALPKPSLSDVQQVSLNEAKGELYIGPFVDTRAKNYKSGYTPEYLGTIRGGFGNVIRRLTDTRGADEFAVEQFIRAGRASSFHTDRTPDGLILQKAGIWRVSDNADSNNIRPVLIGTINDLSVEVFMNRTVEIDMDMKLLDPIKNQIVWAQNFTSIEQSGGASGVFENNEALKGFLAKLIQDKALELLGSEELQKLITDISKKSQKRASEK